VSVDLRSSPHRGVHTVLIVEVDHIDSEPFERAFDGPLDVLRPAIQAYPTRTSVGLELITELGRDHDVSAERRERVAHEEHCYGCRQQFLIETLHPLPSLLTLAPAGRFVVEFAHHTAAETNYRPQTIGGILAIQLARSLHL
jgi:hypothetical protein